MKGENKTKKQLLQELAELRKALVEPLAATQVQHLQSEITKNMSEGVYLVRVSDVVIVYANPMFEEMFGYDQGEMIGKHASIVNAPTGKSPQETADEIMEFIAKEGYWRGEINNIKKDGTPFWCYASVTVFDHPEHGQVLVAVHTDITERVQAQQELQKRTHDLSERVKELSCLYGIASLIENPNLSLEDIFQETVDLIPPAWQYPEITCARISLGGKEISTSGFQETSWRQSSGIMVDSETVGLVDICYLEERPGSDEGPFLKEERALINAIAGQLGNVLEQVWAEQALHENERWLDGTLRSIGDAVIAADEGGQVIFMNPVAENLTGWSQEDALGCDLADVFHIVNEETGAQAENPVQLVLREGAVVGLANHTLLISKDGVEIPVDDSGAPIRDDKGAITGVVLVFRDVTERRRAEEALREREQHLSSIYDTVADVIFHLAVETGDQYRFISVNRTFSDVTGLGFEQVVGKTVNEIIPEPSLTMVLRNYRKAIAEKTVVRWEETSDYPTGRLTGEISVAPVFDKDGTCTHLVGAVHDITERVQAEQALRDGEEKYRTLFEHLPIPVFTKNREGEYTSCNAENQKYWAASLVGRTDAELLDHETASRLREHDLHVMESGETLTVEEHFGNTPLGAREFIASKVPLRDGSGNVVGILGASLDISERVQAEQALINERNFAESLVATAQAITLVLDVEGRIVFFNPYMEQLSGYSLPEVQGKDWFSTFLPAQDQSKTRALFQKAVGDIQTMGKVDRILTKDGRTCQIEWYDKTLKDAAGNVTGLLSIGLDITERMQAEQALRLQSEVIANMNEGMCLVRLSDETILDVNPRFEQMFGYDRGELHGKNISILNAPNEKNPEEIAREIWRTLDKEGYWRGEINNIKKDGTQFWNQASLVVFDHPELGRIQISVQSDITERKQAEEALRESEERYRNLFEESPISLWEEDFSDVKTYIEGLRDTGVKDMSGHFENNPEAVARSAALVRVVGVNKATLKLYDAGSIDEFREGLGVVFSEESYDVFRNELIALADGETRFDSEAITRTLKGDKVHIVMRCSVAPGYEETLSKVFVSIEDITERKQAEEALRLQSEVIANMNEGMCLVRLSDETILDTNPKFEQMFGYGQGELLGKNISILNDPTEKNPEEIARVIRRALDKEGYWRGEINNIKKDGTRFWSH
ncbi:MAG: PAS domain S-box protein, partial [Anaerolineaceae bacterium]|nr:PAS domain S-box protein [Anaerolineaceae bacterium]